jgi:hypothetical protein
MRDDLHKKAPIPRKAQSVLKLALREADRVHPERLQAAARGALEQFIARNFSQPVLRALGNQHIQGNLFGFTTSTYQASSPAEGDVLASLSRAPNLSSGQAALEAALFNVCDSYVRESRATLIAEGVRDIGAAISAFSSALYHGVIDVARSVCTGEMSLQSTPPLTLEENLLPPTRGTKK